MSGTKSFPADNVKLHIASAADAPTGTMTVLMRTNRYYTDGSLLQTGEQYTVTKEWGQDALSRNWCEDVADVFPETETPSGLTADEVSLIRGVVSGAGIGPLKIDAPTGTERGDILTATPTPGWTVATYQWTRDGADIVGQTSSTYTLTLADEGALIGCRAGSPVFSALLEIPAGTYPSGYLSLNGGVLSLDGGVLSLV